MLILGDDGHDRFYEILQWVHLVHWPKPCFHCSLTVLRLYILLITDNHRHGNNLWLHAELCFPSGSLYQCKKLLPPVYPFHFAFPLIFLKVRPVSLETFQTFLVYNWSWNQQEVQCIQECNHRLAQLFPVSNKQWSATCSYVLLAVSLQALFLFFLFFVLVMFLLGLYILNTKNQ